VFVPKKVVPAGASTGYCIGVPADHANVIAQQGMLTGLQFDLQRLGARLGLAVAAGRLLQGDLGLSVPVTATVRLQGLLASLDNLIPVDALRLDLGSLQPDGLALDLAQDLGANLTADGTDLLLRVPQQVQFLGESRLLAWVRGSSFVGGVVREQAVLWRGVAGATTAASFLPAPVLLSPPPNAQVPKDGFQVTWQAPGGIVFQELELVGSDLSGKTFYWRVLVPPEWRAFTFPQLPSDVDSPLVANQIYRLRIACYRVSEGFAADRADGYPRIHGTIGSLGRGALGITAVSAATIAISTPP
jgi:hypothetical protein